MLGAKWLCMCIFMSSTCVHVCVVVACFCANGVCVCLFMAHTTHHETEIVAWNCGTTFKMIMGFVMLNIISLSSHDQGLFFYLWYPQFHTYGIAEETVEH